MFHFIGKNKPWNQRSYGGDGFSEATSRWWSVYEKHFGWKLREEEYKRNQESALRRAREPPSRPVIYTTSTPESPRPSTPVKKQVTFAADTTFHHPTAPPELPHPSSFHDAPRPPSPERMASPQKEPSPPKQPSPKQPSPPPFEPTMVTWDPARSAPPVDAGPEAHALSIAAYESAWDKPFNPDEPKWVAPPPSPLPKGYQYTPPAPPPKSYDSSDESEDETETMTVPPSSRSDSEGPETPPQIQQFNPIFPWETSQKRRIATRVFPGDVSATSAKGKSVETIHADRRPSLDNYEFTNAYALHLPRI